MCCLLRRRNLLLPGNRAKVDQKELLDVKKSFTCNDVNGLQEDGEMEHDLRVFIYASLMAATGDFSEENKLGEGGFGPVYKGKLMTGREVAVKRLSRCSVKGLEFKNELTLIFELVTYCLMEI
ncbi:PREDICTED: G-type lectin S-receptor-like serine/threonine-protein kinase At1g67520 [Prunus mume]|uniref:G-type lectin S-receptor-like serine/threonine-protein kinase At1g67520 n=1 Tax=Prunus mume TaxID=102107 RepID=A0ABM1LMC1_PRUMU|nr:PREDICTED: G-type lectin S-receptor-like serine/threonine-protein kinase At1g67520 [Prunus mume]